MTRMTTGRPLCDARPQPAAAAALAAAVRDALAAARLVWPSVELADDRFHAYLAERIPDDGEPVAALAALHASDLYLACATADGDAAALAAFDVHCLSVVDRALPRLGLDVDMIDEVKQRLRRALLVPERGPPRIVGFGGRGALRSWVRVLAVHEAWGLLRASRGRLDAEDRLADLASAGATPELEYLKRMYRCDFERAFRAALQTLSARERTLLRQHFLDGVGINELGALYRVHRATIGRWLERAREAVLAATRSHLMESLGAPRAEIESILRLVLSRVELNLRPLLARRGA
jgi:RNA polymerase sigma-70 factor (ECF subfamily)